MDNDDELRRKGMTRAKLMSGYAWIAVGLGIAAVVAVCIVGIAAYAWRMR